MILKIQNISKSWSETDILNDVNLEINYGETVAILGKSGSGKSTLLQICGLLETPTTGRILICERECVNISDYEKTLIRRTKVGFVYQFHHLLSEFSVIENLVIPQLINGIKKINAIDIAKKKLQQLDLINKMNLNVNQLSGGEKQRIAIARSIINNPALIIADEPTGNLDNYNAKVVFKLFNDIVQENQAGLLVATHSLELADLCSKIIQLNNGKLICNSK